MLLILILIFCSRQESRAGLVLRQGGNWPRLIDHPEVGTGHGYSVNALVCTSPNGRLNRVRSSYWVGMYICMSDVCMYVCIIIVWRYMYVHVCRYRYVHTLRILRTNVRDETDGSLEVASLATVH